jgi:hypothetical protein
MKNSERGSNKKLTIFNFEKLKGTIYPAVSSPHSFVFQIKVNDISAGDGYYVIDIEYGADVFSKTSLKVEREITASNNGFYGYRIETKMPAYTANTHFMLSQFETPQKFLKELSSYIKTEIETLPF